MPIRALAVLSALAALAACATAPATDFASLAGTWSGVQMRDGADPRPMEVSIMPDGRYTWISTGVTVTEGQLALQDGAILYENEAGSRGTVTAGENELQFVNTFTGDDYRVTLRR